MIKKDVTKLWLMVNKTILELLGGRSGLGRGESGWRHTVLRRGRFLSKDGKNLRRTSLYLYLNVALPSGVPMNKTGFLRGNTSTPLSATNCCWRHRVERRENGVWHERLFRTLIRAWLLPSTDSGVTLYSTDSCIALLKRSSGSKDQILTTNSLKYTPPGKTKTVQSFLDESS